MHSRACASQAGSSRLCALGRLVNGSSNAACCAVLAGLTIHDTGCNAHPDFEQGAGLVGGQQLLVVGPLSCINSCCGSWHSIAFYVFQQLLGRVSLCLKCAVVHIDTQLVSVV